MILIWVLVDIEIDMSRAGFCYGGFVQVHGVGFVDVIGIFRVVRRGVVRWSVVLRSWWWPGVEVRGEGQVAAVF